MKLTKRHLRRIIEEQVDMFSARHRAGIGIRNAIVEYMEAERVFEEKIPQSVIEVIENASLRAFDQVLETVDAAKEPQRQRVDI